MSTESSYRNAPIAEAVIDLRVAAGVTLPSREDLVARFPTFRHVEEEFRLSGHITGGPNVQAAASAKQELSGFILRDLDAHQVVKVDVGGFLFAQLAPYQSWEALEEHARSSFQQLSELVGGGPFVRVAVRYINRFDLDPDQRVDDVLRIAPSLPDGVDGRLGGFFSRCEVEQPDLDATLVISIARLESDDPDRKSCLLDIDLFRLSKAGIGDNEIWTVLSSFRARKNQVFENSVTELAKEALR